MFVSHLDRTKNTNGLICSMVTGQVFHVSAPQCLVCVIVGGGGGGVVRVAGAAAHYRFGWRYRWVAPMAVP